MNCPAEARLATRSRAPQRSSKTGAFSGKRRKPSAEPDGALVVKVFHGSGYSQLVKMFKETFRVVKPLKPKASRDKSSETFLVGIGLKPVE